MNFSCCFFFPFGFPFQLIFFQMVRIKQISAKVLFSIQVGTNRPTARRLFRAANDIIEKNKSLHLYFERRLLFELTKVIGETSKF